jgi:hypothetical protein
MVHSSMLAITTDSELLTYGGFSLNETVHFGSLEFMGTAHNRSPSLHPILEDSSDEFNMTSSGEGSSYFPTSQRHSMGMPPAPIITTPWSEDVLAPQTMAMDPPRTIVLWPGTEQSPK